MSGLSTQIVARSGPRRRDAQVIDVSVCVVNYNGRDVLHNCLASLFRAGGEVALEVIVVENASTDGSAEMVGADFPEAQLIRNTVNAGFARANNQAAERARGRYFLFLNNDTIVPPGALRGLVDFADSHPEAGMVGPRLRDGRGRVQVSCRARPDVTTFLNRISLVRWLGFTKARYRRYRREAFDPHATRPVDVLMGAAVLMPRALFMQIGRWDEGYRFGGEDLDLCWRVSQRSPLYYYPKVEITHLGRVSTRREIGPASAKIAAGFARYLRRSGNSRASVWLYKMLVTLDTPVELVFRTAQYVGRSLAGRRDRARQSWLLMCGLAYFLVRGLPAFWKA